MLTFLLYIFIFSSLTIFSSEECSLPPKNQRDLLILPDTLGEESLEILGFNAVNENQINQLENALRFKPAPLLVELSIWKRFVKNNKLHWLNINDFIWYQFGNYILCIPKAIFDTSTDTGFNLDKGVLIKNPLNLKAGYFEPAKTYAKIMLSTINIYTSIVEVLRTLLKTDYAWNIAIRGHGGGSEGYCSLSAIAGIPYNEFKNLLGFLEKEIKTNILIYSTCFGGGKWLLTVYNTDGKPDTYNFPIIIAGFTESPSYYAGWDVKTNSYEFFDTIKKLSVCSNNINQIALSVGAMFQAVKFNKNTQKYSLSTSENILQIRWPGQAQFQIISLPSVVETAKNIPSKTNQKRLLSDTHHVESQAFILDTPVIDKTLIFPINKNIFEATDFTIASSIPYKWHYIKGILFTQEEEKEHAFMYRLFSSFKHVLGIQSEKIFLIDSVNNIYNQVGAHHVMVFINARTPSTRLFKNRAEIFYMIGDEGYTISDIEEPVKLKPQVTQSYVKLFEDEKKKLLESANM